MTEARFLIAVVLPYAALAVFVAGLLRKMAEWARAPVPFRIPTTCGQQKSLPWIRAAWLENPWNGLGAAARVASEVLLFRSLARNHASERHGARLVPMPSPGLWLAALAFHWSLAVALVRHLRFFLEPVPRPIAALQAIDGFFQAGMPPLYVSDVALVVSLGFLLGRRALAARTRYISLPVDYLAPVLLLALAGSGLLLRHAARVDAAEVKRYALGLAAFSPAPPPAAGALFYLHVLLASALLASIPFSKLMHMGGIFLSPTRNLANNSRRKRHVNPWNPAAPPHSYGEWEDEFRTKMKAAGLPLEKP